MDTKNYFLICIILFITSCRWNDVRAGGNTEISEISEILRAAKDIKTDSILIIFDVDNTLLTADELIGSERWVEWFLHETNKLGGCPFDIINMAYEMGSMSLTDPLIIDAYKYLPNYHYP